MTEAGYLDLVQWTGEQAHPIKRGKLYKKKTDSANNHQKPLVIGPQSKAMDAPGSGHRKPLLAPIGSAER